MKERPIIFSKSNINAILAGAKSQTRRVLKLQPSPPSIVTQDENGQWGALWYSLDNRNDPTIEHFTLFPNPYGGPGSKLWVREICRAEELADGSDGVRYLADNAWRVIESIPKAAEKWVALNCYQGVKGATVPSIFMPRWASRITLEITDVRVQKLQDISEIDAMAEGIAECEIPADDYGPIRLGYMVGPDDGKSILTPLARDSFRKLWDSINGKLHPWHLNEWVWALSFRRL